MNRLPNNLQTTGNFQLKPKSKFIGIKMPIAYFQLREAHPIVDISPRLVETVKMDVVFYNNDRYLFVSYATLVEYKQQEYIEI